MHFIPPANFLMCGNAAPHSLASGFLHVFRLKGKSLAVSGSGDASEAVAVRLGESSAYPVSVIGVSIGDG